ncbi:hypothetical protein GEV33_011860 [Tenebrio molitor]|uniref:Uncharacterized protein n=1 Tax=Tenebrio molitor TaxID=7067 RepID=A0A8J6HBC8_TENMO|nr:hypothetical protein GEV33_011860 [Tenebrio molitor]
MICAGILMEYKDEETDQRRKEREFLPGQTPRVVLAEQLAGRIIQVSTKDIVDHLAKGPSSRVESERERVAFYQKKPNAYLCGGGGGGVPSDGEKERSKKDRRPSPDIIAVVIIMCLTGCDSRSAARGLEKPQLRRNNGVMLRSAETDVAVSSNNAYIQLKWDRDGSRTRATLDAVVKQKTRQQHRQESSSSALSPTLLPPETARVRANFVGLTCRQLHSRLEIFKGKDADAFFQDRSTCSFRVLQPNRDGVGHASVEFLSSSDDRINNIPAGNARIDWWIVLRAATYKKYREIGSCLKSKFSTAFRGAIQTEIIGSRSPHKFLVDAADARADFFRETQPFRSLGNYGKPRDKSSFPQLASSAHISDDVARILQFVVYMQQAELNGFQDRSRNTQHFVMAIRPFFNSPECRKVFRKTFYRLGIAHKPVISPTAPIDEHVMHEETVQPDRDVRLE